MAGVTNPALDLVSHDTRSDWVRLRTLLVLRWLAILGQTVTVVTASFYLGLRVELGLCFLAIGASVISNLIAMSIFPENQRLSDRDAMLTLLFDLAQLSFLLFLTGGLNNPFALLILAPVTISATALTMRSTTILGSLAIVLISLGLFSRAPHADHGRGPAASRPVHPRILDRHRHLDHLPVGLCPPHHLGKPFDEPGASGHADGARAGAEADRPWWRGGGRGA